MYSFRYYDILTSNWTFFYPIISVYPTEIYDSRPLYELPERIYGKFCRGYNIKGPIWIYSDISKLTLVEEGKSNSTISEIW